MFLSASISILDNYDAFFLSYAALTWAEFDFQVAILLYPGMYFGGTMYLGRVGSTFELYGSFPLRFTSDG